MIRGGKTQRMLLAKARVEALEEAAAIARRYHGSPGTFDGEDIPGPEVFRENSGEAIARAIEKLARETKL